MRKITNDQIVYLGDIFYSVELAFKETCFRSPYNGWPEISFSTQNILGINCYQSSLSAPFEDRPVLQQTFDLTLKENGITHSLKSEYLSKLNHIFGNPIVQTEYETKEYHQVRFTSKWKKEDYRISLSIYGSPRKQTKEIITAGLYFDLCDEEKIAIPFLEARREVEKNVWKDLKNTKIICKIRTIENNSPYYRPDFDDGISRPEDMTNILRLSQKALYKKELLETPNVLVEASSNNEIIVWENSGKYFLSMMQDTINLSSEINDLEFHRIKPARGTGGKRLIIGEMSLQDDLQSISLEKLAKCLENLIKKKVIYKDYYDD